VVAEFAGLESAGLENDGLLTSDCNPGIRESENGPGIAIPTVDILHKS